MNPNVLAASRFGPMIINVNDRFIGRQIVQHGAWALNDIRLLERAARVILQSGSTVTFLDVGANIGSHAVALAQRFQHLIDVHAFEAQRQVFYMLCGNVALNGLRNVTCHLTAIADTDGEVLHAPAPDYGHENNFGAVELRPPPLNSENHLLVTTGGEEAISTRTIDSLGLPANLIKLDIEGMELAALEGARRTLEAHRPFLYVEVMKTDLDKLSAFLAGFDYAGYRLENDLMAIPRGAVLPLEAQRLF